MYDRPINKSLRDILAQGRLEYCNLSRSRAMCSGFRCSSVEIEVAFTLHELLRDTATNYKWRQTCFTALNAFLRNRISCASAERAFFATTRTGEEAEAQDLLRFLRNYSLLLFCEDYGKEARLRKQD